MAHPLNDIINRAAGRNPVPCTDKCKYWRFPRSDCACELSSVFSVGKGEPCYEFVERSPVTDETGKGETTVSDMSE